MTQQLFAEFTLEWDQMLARHRFRQFWFVIQLEHDCQRRAWSRFWLDIWSVAAKKGVKQHA